MGLRGPKPTPSAIKVARGTWRADRAAPHEPTVSGKPSCPAWLQPEAKKEFRRLVRLLGDMGVIGQVDGNALSRYATTWLRWRQAIQMIEKTGEIQVVRGDDGKPTGVKPSPYIYLARSLAEQLDKLEAAFGLNPSARSRITVSNPPESKDADKSRFFDSGPFKFNEGAAS